MYTADEKLVSQTLAGDRDAFGVLVHKYQDMVYTYAYQKVRNVADSQDITQEVFLKAFRHLQKLRHPHLFRSWLYTIMSNECKRWLVRVTRRRRHEIALEQAVDDSLQIQPEHTVPTQDWQVDLEQAMSELSDESRIVVSMFYAGDYSLKEISEFFGVSVNTVKSKLRRARLQLGSALSEHYGRVVKSRKLKGGFLMQLIEQIRHIPSPTMGFTWGSTSVSKALISLIMALCVLVGLFGERSDSPNVSPRNQIGLSPSDTSQPIPVAFITPAPIAIRPLIAGIPTPSGKRPPGVSNRGSTVRSRESVELGSVSGNGGVKNATPQHPAVAAKGEDEKLIYSGRVVDSDGAPVADAELFYPSKLKSFETVTRTAPDGTFHFEVQRPDDREQDRDNIVITHPIVATHPNHAIGWQNLPLKSKMDVEIQLGTQEVISGRVLNTAGVPIQNAEVRIKSLYSNATFSSNPILWDLFLGLDIISIIPPTNTDTNGEFVLRRLPPDVTASLVIHGQGYAEEMRFPVPPGASGLEFRLEREARIEGRLSYADTGAPVKNATIALLRISPLTAGMGAEHVSVDENGNYLLKNIAPGMYNLYLDEVPEGWTAASNEFFKVAEGQIMSNINLTLVRGGHISGRVTDQDTKEPVANHHIRFHDTARPGPEFGPIDHVSTTDEFGIYSFRAAPGRVLVSTYAPQDYQNVGQVTRYVDVVEGETVVVDFQFSKGLELSGRVLTKAGEPVSGVIIAKGRNFLSACDTSDEQGEFTVRGLRIGQKLALKAEHSELELRGTAEVEVQPDASVEILIEPYERVKVAGRVVDRAGEPIPSVNINLLYFDRQSEIGLVSTVAVTDGDGRYREIELIVGDEYTISANAEGYWTTATETFTATAEMTQIADLILLPEVGQFYLEGRITNTSGQPVHGARVYTHYQSQGWDTYTDENGNFRFDNLLMAVVINLQTHHPAFARHRFKMLKANQRHDLVLIEGDGYLAGKVVDANGKPINQASVRVEAEEDVSGYFYTGTSTNGLGEFEMKHIKDQMVSISVSADRNHKIFESIAVNQRDLVLTLTPSENKPEPTPEQQLQRSYAASAEDRFNTLLNKTAPELAVAKWLSGSPVSIGELEGKTIVLHFWDLNRSNHIQWIRLLNILHEVYGEKGLVCVAVCPAASEIEAVKRHITEQLLSCSIGLDRPATVDGAKGETFERYAVGWHPFILINAAGEIAGRSWEHDLEAKVQTLIVD